MAGENTDLVLTNGTFALLRDNTKGIVSSIVGPLVHSRSGSETPVVWDPGARIFNVVDFLQVVQRFVTARRNQYVVLANPAVNDKAAHPSAASKQMAVDLKVGEVEIIPGPCTFALWPGQSAEVVDGHALRSNQYLIIEVLDEDAARANWGRAVFKRTAQQTPQVRAELQAQNGELPGDAQEVAAQQPASITDASVPADLAVGQQYLIKGDEVRFFMPATGMRVLKDGGAYVRDALTLEILEYAILLDENGAKTFPKGPCVVFPSPSQTFVEAGKGEEATRSFRPIELNDIQGLHLKALRAHTFMGRDLVEGEEFFLTGKECKLYYPSPLHASVKYDGKAQHYAVCVPEGDTRYVLDRKTGKVEMVSGPTMLLPNPVESVIVRRVLSESQCALWYPGSAEAAAYNRALREQAEQTPTTRTGVSEGQAARSRALSAQNLSSGMETSRVSNKQGMVGEEISRSSSYNQPRTVTLADKFSGAPVIMPWPGYAVMVVSKTGDKQVVVGGERHHLEYHEELMPFVFSTGRPKSAKNRKTDVYLRVANNAVRDEVTVVTKDHVPVKLYLSYRVAFEGTTQTEMAKWWAVEDYVKFLCDHARSKLQALVRKMELSAFWDAPADVVRDILLGVKTEGAVRPGLFFVENQLRVLDIDVLEVGIADNQVQAAVTQTAQQVVMGNLTLTQRRQAVNLQAEDVALMLQRIELSNKESESKKEAALLEHARQRELADAATSLRMQQQEATAQHEMAELQAQVARTKVEREAEAQSAAQTQLEVAAHNAEAERHLREVEGIKAATFTAQYGAMQGPLAQALVSLGDKQVVQALAQATAVQRIVKPEDLEKVLGHLLGPDLITPVMALLKKGGAQ